MVVLRKVLLYVALFCFVAGLTGCADTAIDYNSKVVSPQNKTVPLQGEWKIKKCKLQEQESLYTKYDEQWEGKKAAFSSDEAMMGDYYWKEVRYKIKRVNAQEYFLHKFKDNVGRLGINDEEVYVVTLSSADKFLYEFVKLNDNELVVDIDGEFFRLTKVSDEVTSELYSEAVSNQIKKEITELRENEYVKSGILLGLRTPRKAGTGAEDSVQDYSYRTIWVASNNRHLNPIIEADGIFLPRKNGFWHLELVRAKIGENEEDILTAESISGRDKDIASRGFKIIEDRIVVPEYWKNRSGVLYRTILFVGNDFVSVETFGQGNYKGTSRGWEENRLQTLPVDNVQRGEGVKISDIAGENGSLAIESAVRNLLDKSDAKVATAVEAGGLEENFALFRKTGHWFVKGRVNLEQGDSIPYVDYNINIIPPPELVAYDTLHIPWKNIKDKVPGAVDAYTSPNRDVALVITKDHILIYSIEGEKLSDTPLGKIGLEDGDAVVMAEWARGDYMEKWEKSFIKNNKTRIVKLN